jgi:tRNA(fMet)-specific endonuclease VapC
MLDTDIVSYLLKGRHPSVTRQFLERGFEGICISACTVSELLYGIDARLANDRLREGIVVFLDRVNIIPWDKSAAETHSRIRYCLDRAGQTIGVMDQMIAAHAISLGLVLVTNNVRHHSRIEPELTVENWVEPTD